MAPAPQTLRRGLRYLSRPRWGVAYWRGRHGTVPGERKPGFSLADHAERLHDPAGAIAAVTGAARSECERALASAWLPPAVPHDAAAWWPRESLMRTVAALTRLTQPRTVVEVGVARGYSSAAILRALESEGGDGRLFSIDLPPLDEDAGFVGKVVPTELRSRWLLSLGPSRDQLPRLLPRIAAVDLFVHDGDHSYDSQREDLETIWPQLRPGAIAVVDDVWSEAVFEVADEHGANVAVVAGAFEHDGIALVRKPSPG
jgi:predicted O-methyltransferase YrrM